MRQDIKFSTAFEEDPYWLLSQISMAIDYLLKA